MIRLGQILFLTVVAFCVFNVIALGIALGQVMVPSAHAGTAAEPLNALWSLVGGTPIAALLYLWVRSEQADRRAAVTAKENTVAQMLKLFEGDAEHKAAIRERLHAQDTLLAKLVEQNARSEQALARLEARRVP
jgi:hypothetical protein